MAGRFISLEGGEGTGKSTQVQMLVQWLKNRNIDVVTTREPGGTPGAESIRKLLLTGKEDRWNLRAETLLFAAARADHVQKLILPTIAQGKWVVCDRYIDSSRAYQGGRTGISDTDIMKLHMIGSGGLLPDMTIVLDMPTDIATDRAFLRDAGASDRIAMRNRVFHDGVKKSFKKFAADDSDRFKIIDASGTPDDVHAHVSKFVAELL